MFLRWYPTCGAVPVLPDVARKWRQAHRREAGFGFWGAAFGGSPDQRTPREKGPRTPLGSDHDQAGVAFVVVLWWCWGGLVARCEDGIGCLCASGSFVVFVADWEGAWDRVGGHLV